MGLRRHGVLIGEDGIGGGEVGRGGGTCVDGGYHREVVLVFEEVRGCCGEGSVERVEEGGVEGSEGEFVDYVGEVEGWNSGRW